MRCLALLLVGLAACGPKVDVSGPSPYEIDDPRAGAPMPDAARWEDLPEAPPGPGARTGTIDRTALTAVLDAGPGAFLHGFEVAAELEGSRFYGWRLVQTMPGETRFIGLDVQPGDVLVAINARPIARPEQLQEIWESLRTADELVLDLERNGGRFQVRFAIEPKLEQPLPSAVPAAP